MKVVLAFALLAIVPFALADRGYTQGHNGRPACETAAEVEAVVWRNNFDPTKFWKCEKLNEPGVSETCKTAKLFQPNLNECVNYLDWVWTPLEDPPSMAPMP